jgi:23S rRNA (uracil1939-C5)-methyltransferase
MNNSQHQCTINKLSHEGRGVAKINDKTSFIDGALPEEIVTFKYNKQKSQFNEGSTLSVIKSSQHRVEPLCPHFTRCGGCSLQYMHNDLQMEFKENALTELLARQNIITDKQLPALNGPLWGYRRRARLSVKWVAKKNRVLVGFREKNPRYIADLTRCDILEPSIGLHLTDLETMIESTSIKNKIPQIEIACGDHFNAIVIRHLEPLLPSDLDIIKTFSETFNAAIYFQSKGIDTVTLYHTPTSLTDKTLSYQIPDHNINIQFEPTHFTQVNQSINLQMINQAIRLLDLQPKDRVIDLFCGIGNFTLPIARYTKQVHGIEFDQQSVKQAADNAALNALNNTQFFYANLFELPADASWLNNSYNKMLLDPPRAGAKEVVENINKWSPDRIVYVSCNPATLARDAAILSQQGYRLESSGIMNMFPHTKHVEAMCLFIKNT